MLRYRSRGRVRSHHEKHMLADTNRKHRHERGTARGQFTSPHFQITVPGQITGREILFCDATPEKTWA